MNHCFTGHLGAKPHAVFSHPTAAAQRGGWEQIKLAPGETVQCEMAPASGSLC